LKTNDATAVVYGVLYEIPVGERQALDQEGLGNGYEAKSAEVVFKGARRIASLYHATEIDPTLKPDSWYKAFVVVGAKEHGLPGTYIEQLVAIDAIEDPDRERHSRNWQLSPADRFGLQ
jgi:hypothetical protein